MLKKILVLSRVNDLSFSKSMHCWVFNELCIAVTRLFQTLQKWWHYVEETHVDCEFLIVEPIEIFKDKRQASLYIVSLSFHLLHGTPLNFAKEASRGQTMITASTIIYVAFRLTLREDQTLCEK